MYGSEKHEAGLPLDSAEWQRRTRENLEACDRIATLCGGKLLTVEERSQVGRMVGRQMQHEMRARKVQTECMTSKRAAGSEERSDEA